MDARAQGAFHKGRRNRSVQIGGAPNISQPVQTGWQGGVGAATMVALFCSSSNLRKTTLSTSPSNPGSKPKERASRTCNPQANSGPYSRRRLWNPQFYCSRRPTVH